MNSLAHPWLLLLLLLVPPLTLWRFRRRARLTFPFSDGAALAVLPGSWAVTAQRLLPVLYALGLALLVVALARPRRGLDESRVRTEAVDIVLAMDVSPSMRALDLSTPGRRMDRLQAVMGVLDDFIRRRDRDRIGLLVFAGMPYTVAPLTLDHGWLRERVKTLRVGMVGDSTAIGSALASAVNRLKDSVAKSKVIVLLSDGSNNAGRIAPDEAAQLARATGIKVHTIAVGTDQGSAPVPVNVFGVEQLIQQPVELDEPQLIRIAEATGGAFFRATNLKKLEEIYQHIDKLERTAIEVDQFTRFEETFGGWALAGLLLLGLERLLAFGRLGGLPA